MTKRAHKEGRGDAPGGGRRKGRARAEAAPAGSARARDDDPAPLPLPRPAGPSPLFVETETAADLLAPARTHWQYGKWGHLVALDRDGLDRHPDRAKLALLAAAGHMQVGTFEDARRAVARALAWGVDRALAARVLCAAVHATLGRVGALTGDDAAAAAHARESLGLVEPKADLDLLARTRDLRERMRLGLLPDAARLLGEEVEAARADPAQSAARLEMVAAELGVLTSELRLSVIRGQLYRPPTNELAPPDLAARAVSQLGQDLWVLERSGMKRGGYFVDFGASDGVLLSNTWLLESEFGWTGICAEPNPAFHAELRRNRRCIVSDACVGAETGTEVEFVAAGVYGGLAAFAEADQHAARRHPYAAAGAMLRLTTVSLDDLLRRHGAPQEIDYLSIDTEGSEYDILRTFPFDRWRIRLITVEHNFTPQRELIRTLLEGHGYRRTEAKWDDWYELVA